MSEIPRQHQILTQGFLKEHGAVPDMKAAMVTTPHVWAVWPDKPGMPLHESDLANYIFCAPVSDLELRSVYSSHGASSYGAYGIEIKVRMPQRELTETEWAVVNKVQKEIHGAFMATRLALDPAARAEAASERAGIMALFAQPIFVEELPNGYCSDWCCTHLPWFKVTTTKGHITVGWRKRVLNIDWAALREPKHADELFAYEDVTKGKHSIHAWSLEKAREYITKLLA